MNESDEGMCRSLSRKDRGGWVPFRVVQPWGRDKVQQSSILSEHPTAAAAFAEIDRLSSEMVRTGAPPNAIELVVIDVERATIIRRSGTH